MTTVNEPVQSPNFPLVARFPHICWEPLYSIPPLRTTVHSIYDHHHYQTQQTKVKSDPLKTSTKRERHQVKDADALVVATLASRHLLQQVRHRTGLQQTQLAHIVSVPWTDIRDLESGARPISLSVLEKVSRALDTPLIYSSDVS